MRLFLAINTPNTGMLYPDFKRMKEAAKKQERESKVHVYLAGSDSRVYIPDMTVKGGIEALQLYLSGTGLGKYAQDGSNLLSLKGARTFYVLESFAYITADDLLIPLIPYFKDFFLDSGAFTFLQKNGGKVDFDAYLKKYIAFINKYQIKNFFELDVDAVVGYKKVLEYREKLEQGTGRKCIPVWHRNCGKDEFIRLCEDYDYVALGGIAIREIKRTEHKYFPWFINTAHKYGAKIHGLGYTNLTGLHKYHFDSVDSSSWTSGNRFGYIYKFNGHGLDKFDKPVGMRVKSRKTAVNNFIEWVKFAQWAETHL